MSWNGDSNSYDFVLMATDRVLIEKFADIIRADFPKALPPKKLKIVEKELGKNVNYAELSFSYNYGFHEIFRLDFLQSCFSNLFVMNRLLPFYTVRIEMIITRSNMNEYTNHTNEDIIYFCSPAQYPKTIQ